MLLGSPNRQRTSEDGVKSGRYLGSFPRIRYPLHCRAWCGTNSWVLRWQLHMRTFRIGSASQNRTPTG